MFRFHLEIRIYLLCTNTILINRYRRPVVHRIQRKQFIDNNNNK